MEMIATSKMRRAQERGLAGRINRDFDRFRRFYGRVLDATLSARPAVYIVWLVLSLLTLQASQLVFNALESFFPA